MKVLLANKFFHLNGGTERVLFQERQFLLDRGVQVLDFSMADQRNFESPYSNFFVSHVDYDTSRGVWEKLKNGVKFVHSKEAVDKIERLVLAEKPDVAHLHNIYHQITPSIIPALKRHGVKVALTLHDYKLICPSYLMLDKGVVCSACAGRHFWNPIVRNCQGTMLRELLLAAESYWHKWKKTYEEVDVFVAPSRYMADMVGERVGADRISVLHNGIDIGSYEPKYSDRGYGLYLGRLSKEKGVETLLKAHEMMGDRQVLKIVGTGPMEKDCKAGYPNAQFLGYKVGDELKALISEAAFVIVPSEWHENCSMVVLEAMAMGKPVIGSRTGGIPEQVADGKTGLLFEMGNAKELAEKMQSLSEAPSLRVQLGRAAREKVEKEYSLKQHCDGLLKIYGQLLN